MGLAAEQHPVVVVSRQWAAGSAIDAEREAALAARGAQAGT